MNIISKIELKSKDFIRFLSILESAEENLTPKSVSRDENGPKNVIEPNELIAQFCSEDFENDSYFLYCASSRISVVKKDQMTSLLIESEEDTIAKAYMLMCIDLNVEYGFACNYEERKNQNKIIVERDYGVVERWVGRNFRAQIPGLYWMNLIPKKLLTKHKIDIEKLSKFKGAVITENDVNLLIQMYCGSQEWRNFSEKIEKICKKSPGLFHKELAESQLKKAKNLIEASQIARRWS